MNVLKKYIVPIALGIGLGLVLDLGYIQLVGKEALTFVNVMFLFLFIVCAYIIHIALHELGHLVFGLMSGFEFISYRFGSNMWIKQEGKLF